MNNGVVIASNSVVVKDVEPYTIVGGNPAKIIKKSFNEDVINDLLKINENLEILCSDNFDKIKNIK